MSFLVKNSEIYKLKKINIPININDMKREFFFYGLEMSEAQFYSRSLISTTDVLYYSDKKFENVIKKGKYFQKPSFEIIFGIFVSSSAEKLICCLKFYRIQNFDFFINLITMVIFRKK